MLTTNLYMFMFKKNDDYLAQMESYNNFITKKEIIIPKDGIDEHYYVIYCNFGNPSTVLKDDTLFLISIKMEYSTSEADNFGIGFKFNNLITDKIVSDIGQFYILDGDKQIIVDVSKQEGNEKIGKFVTELNKYSGKEFIYKSNQLIKKLMNIMDDLLEKDETIVD